MRDIASIESIAIAPHGKSNRWITVVLITPEEFSAEREQARPVWKPMHMQPVFQVEEQSAQRKEQSARQKYKARPSEIRSAVVNEFHGVKVVGGSVAEELFERGLCLPSGTAMTEEDLDRVIEAILGCKR